MRQIDWSEPALTEQRDKLIEPALTEQRDKLIGQLVRTSIIRATRSIDWSEAALTEQRDKLIGPNQH
ncbi:hypothetical protein RRG08_056986 [Elysia crispata]|uniref:Uncharacterized protein n=1 Tax=Elysia crispata TaxID=231223 RepID=A0AAE1DAR2_9GAST|nr:hypothetical protein RRG08_056986 [Elysia crispata]